MKLPEGVSMVPLYGMVSPVPNRGEAPTKTDGVRTAIERLVAMRLSTTITSPADRAELDSIIGALTVAVASGSL